MIRVDRLSQCLKESVAETPGVVLMLLIDDGSPFAASDDSEDSQTVGAAAASIFLEYKATDKFAYPPLTSFVYSAKSRTVLCRYMATLSDGCSILLCAFSSSSTPLDALESIVAQQAAQLDYLVPVFSGMARKVVD